MGSHSAGPQAPAGAGSAVRCCSFSISHADVGQRQRTWLRHGCGLRGLPGQGELELWPSCHSSPSRRGSSTLPVTITAAPGWHRGSRGDSLVRVHPEVPQGWSAAPSTRSTPPGTGWQGRGELRPPPPAHPAETASPDTPPLPQPRSLLAPLPN